MSTTYPAADAQAEHVSAEPLWRLGTAYFGRKTVLVAAELGLFTLLSGRTADAEEIRRELGLHPRAVSDLLDALVALEMLERKDGRYANTPVAEHYLNKNRPSYVGAFLTTADARWDRLADALRTGEPQNRWGAGPQMFTEQYRTTEAWRNFNAGMDYLNGMIGPALAGSFDWSRVATVADVGGGRGNLIVPILRRYPHLSAIVFDLPGVEPVCAEHLERLGLSDRARFMVGDFFADPLPTTDVLIFSHVLHDWGVPERRSLLAAAFRALPPGGTVLICDPMIDDDRRGPANALLTSLNMLLVTPHGGEYTKASCKGWLAEAGFTDLADRPLGPNNTLVIGVKPR